MRRRLRRAVLIAGLFGVPAVGLLAWFWWLPSAIEDRIRSTAAARFAATVTIEDVDLAWSGVRVEGIAFEAHGIAASASQVDVGGGLLALASSGTAAVESVSASGCDVVVEPEGVRWLLAQRDDETSTALAAASGEEAGEDASEDPAHEAANGEVGNDEAGDGPTAEEAEGSTNRNADERSASSPRDHLVSRTIELEGALRVRDEHGDVASGSGTLRLADGALRLTDVNAVVGAEPADALSVENLRAVAKSTGEGWVIDQLSVAKTTLTLAGQDEVQSTKARLRALVSPPTDDDDAAAESVDALRPGWMQRLADGASIRIDRFDANRPGVQRPVVSELNASVTRHGDELHLEGEGVAENDGKAEWDLWVAPDTLHGHGHVSLQALPFDLFVPVLPELPWFQPSRTLVDADLQLRADTPARIGFEGHAGVRNLSFNHDRVGPHPVRDISLSARGRGAWVTADRKLEIETGTVRVGSAEASVSGELEWANDHYRVALDASMQPTPCNDAVGAIPGDFLAELQGFSWDGRIGGHAHLVVDSRELDATEFQVRLANRCRFLTVPAMADLGNVRGPFIHRVREPDGSFFEMTAGPGTENWSSIAAMSPYFVQAVVGHEDSGFFSHGGFATYAIRDAIVRNLKAGRYVYGASTITMQLAKNLFLHREKTLARKLQEVLLTWWLEHALTKRDLLELYLNIIEYGPSVYGVVQASAHYFGRRPSELSPGEAAFLACILPNPKGYHGNWDRGQLSTRMQARVRRFLNHMHSRGRIDDAALAYGLAELETMRFYRPGQAIPERVIPGRAGELPFATAAQMPGLEAVNGEEFTSSEAGTPNDGYDYQRLNTAGL